MNRFAANLADITKPLRDQLVKENQWVWGEAQQRAFEEVKKLMTSTTVLAMVDPLDVSNVSGCGHIADRCNFAEVRFDS